MHFLYVFYKVYVHFCAFLFAKVVFFFVTLCPGIVQLPNAATIANGYNRPNTPDYC